MTHDPAEPVVTIHILRGKAASRSREMKGPTLLVGSGPQCDIQMRSPDVAARHCLVTRSPGHVAVRQLDAAFPLLVNGNPVREAALANGDAISVGPFELSVSIEAVAAPPSPRAEDRIATLGRVLRREPAREPAAPAFSRTAVSPIEAAAPTGEESFAPSPGVVQQIERQRIELAEQRQALRADTERQAKDFASLQALLRENARKEADLAQRIAELDRREEAVRASEVALQQQKLFATDELLDLDRAKQHFEVLKSRFARARSKLAERWKSRRAEVAERIAAAENTARHADARCEEAERQKDRYEQMAGELGRRQAELAEQSAELARQAARLEEDRKALAAERGRFEQELQNLRVREKSLERFQADLDERKARVAEEESALRVRRESFEEQFRRIEERSLEAKTRGEEVEGRVRALEKQERYLKDVARGLEEQRQAQLAREQELASAQVDQDQARAELKAREEQLARRESELSIREYAIAEESRMLDREKKKLAEAAEAIGRDRAALDHRESELERHAEAIFSRFEAERAVTEERRQEVERVAHRIEADRVALESEREQWAGRTAEVRQTAADVAEREGIVRLRQAQLDALEDSQESERERIREREQTLAAEHASLDEQKQAALGKLAEAELRAQELSSESSRLAALAEQLEKRQQELLERERVWCDEVQRRRNEVERLAEDVQRKRLLLDRQSMAQRRHVQKLREVGLKVLARRRESRVPPDGFDRGQDEQRKRVERLQQGQERLLAAVARFAADAAQSARESARWIEALRAEGAELATLRETVAEKARGLWAACRAEEGTNGADRKALAAEVQSSLAAWQGLLDRLFSSVGRREGELVRREAELARGREQLDHLVAIVEQCTGAARPSLELAIPAVADPAGGPAPSATYPPSVPDDELTLVLMETRLLEQNELRRVVDAAIQHGHSLEAELLGTGRLTSYQLECIREGRIEALRLGPAVVMDVLHVGAAATTYRVRMPGRDGPVVLRLLDLRYCRDAGLRNSFEIATNALTKFRHPHVAATLGFFSVDARYGAVTEYVDGASLADLSVYAIPPKALVRYCQQTVRALAAAQRAGFVHHNLRPSRVLVDRSGQVRLIGYGTPSWLAKIQRCERGRQSSIFLAPEEQGHSPHVDVRADLYSVGQIFLELSATSGLPRGYQGGFEGYPPGFEQLLLRLCSENPADRCESIEEVDQELDRWIKTAEMQGNPWPELASAIDELRIESAPLAAAA